MTTGYRWLEPKKREWTYPAMRWLKQQDLGRFDVLLTWLWLSAFVVLLGALLDAEIRRPKPDGD